MTNQSRGAPSSGSEPLSKVYIRRIEVNKGGYDSGGVYWGTGRPLYHAYTWDKVYNRYFRANSLADYQAQLRREHPNLEFANNFSGDK